VPLIVILLEVHEAFIPAGKPAGVPIPVAPVVLCVMLGSRVLIHKVGALEAAPAVMFALTVIVPVALTVPQPPVNGME